MTSIESASGERSIFISYAHEDKDFARRLAGDLRNAGVDVWFDESGIEGGSRFGRRIAKEIKARKEFLVIVSPASADSDWVETEIQRAFNQRKGIVPVILKHCDDPPLLLETFHAIDFTPSYDEGFEKLLLSRGEIPPKRSLIRRLAYNNVARIIAALAILIALAFYLQYRFSPSNTSAYVAATNSPTLVTLQLQNRGGKPSAVGGGYLLHFGNLPIEDKALDLDSAPPAEVPGHSTLQVALKTSGFKPKFKDGVTPTANEIRKVLPGHDLILDVNIKESGAPTGRAFGTRRVSFPATRIESFIVEHLPTVVEEVSRAQ